MPSTLYDVLQIPETADPATIKAAYRRLVKTAHPDLVPEPEKPEAQLRFVVLQEAYDTLRDDTRRSVYDRELRAARQQQEAAASQTTTGSAPTGPSTPPPRTAAPPPSAATSSPRIPVSLLRELFPNITNQELAAAYAAAADAEARGEPDAFLKMVHDLRQRHPQPAAATPSADVDHDHTLEYRKRTRERAAVATAAVVTVPLLVAWSGLFTSFIAAADPTSLGAVTSQRWMNYWQQPDRAVLIPAATVIGFVVGWFNTQINTATWNLYLQIRPVRVVALTTLGVFAATTPYWLTIPDTFLIVTGIILAVIGVGTAATRRLWDRWLTGRTMNPVTWTRWHLHDRYVRRRSN